MNSAKLLLSTALAAANAGKKACTALLMLLPSGANKVLVTTAHQAFDQAQEALSAVKL